MVIYTRQKNNLNKYLINMRPQKGRVEQSIRD